LRIKAGDAKICVSNCYHKIIPRLDVLAFSSTRPTIIAILDIEGIYSASQDEPEYNSWGTRRELDVGALRRKENGSRSGCGTGNGTAHRVWGCAIYLQT
jgi:hypothetical protein